MDVNEASAMVIVCTCVYSITLEQTGCLAEPTSSVREHMTAVLPESALSCLCECAADASS